ncbi:MAG: hypothetical protein H7249_00635 [Chitinophagaceae bacterium]|nr:hypothetical protein [Oligoflexus sp.]
MSTLKRFFIATALTALTACHSINSVSLTQIPQQRNKKVTAEVSKFIFLGLNFDNDYVDGLVGKLKDQCAGGQVKGILTKDEVINYFFMIFHTRAVTATGYCVQDGTRKSTASLEPDL